MVSIVSVCPLVELVVELPKRGPEDKRFPKPNNTSFLDTGKKIQDPFLN